MFRAPRHFSTAAKVHPNYLPHMHPRSSPHTPRMATLRWIKPVAALVIVGYGLGTAIASYGQARDRRIAEAEAATQRDLELRRRNQALLDMYGGRDSLEELEKAMAFYEEKK